jgi:hypothetical protein
VKLFAGQDTQVGLLACSSMFPKGTNGFAKSPCFVLSPLQILKKPTYGQNICYEIYITRGHYSFVFFNTFSNKLLVKYKGFAKMSSFLSVKW